MDSAHQAMLRCVKVATEHTALRREAAAAEAPILCRYVCLVKLVSLVCQLESAQIVTQVGTRIQKEVSNARSARKDSRKSREEELRAGTATWAHSPTSRSLSSATTVQKATMQTTMGVHAVLTAPQALFKMKQSRPTARVVKLVGTEDQRTIRLAACRAQKVGIKMI